MKWIQSGETMSTREAYRDVLDPEYQALVEAISHATTPLNKRPAGQLVTHLQWRRPDQHVRWHKGTTRQVPENAAQLSIYEGTPLPDAMEIAMSALAEELSGEAMVLAALDHYRQGVHELNARYGIAPERSFAGAPPAGSAPRGGRPYSSPSRAADSTEEKSSVFERNPDAIDRGTKAHKDIQDGLAEHVRGAGFEPVSPAPGDEQFDVAWVADGTLHICEVKSLTDANEESQLRLGLGQLLSYLYRTKAEDWHGAEEIVGVLALEREPRGSDWTQICASHGVVLTWPDQFSELIQ